MMQSDTLRNKRYQGSRVTGHLRGAQWHPGGLDLPLGVHGTTCPLRGSLALTSAVLKAGYSKAVPSLGLISWKLKRREERIELPSFLFWPKNAYMLICKSPTFSRSEAPAKTFSECPCKRETGFWKGPWLPPQRYIRPMDVVQTDDACMAFPRRQRSPGTS